MHSEQNYQNAEAIQPSEVVHEVSPIEHPVSPTLEAPVERNGNSAPPPTSAITQQQTRPVPDRGGVKKQDWVEQ